MPEALRDYQIADLAFLIANPRALILHDPGGGKTPPVCVWAWWHWSERRKRTLWIMPNSLLKKNRDELLRFTHFAPQDVEIVTKAPTPELMARDPKVMLMSPTRFRISWPEFLGAFPDIDAIAGDETHLYWTTGDSQTSMALDRAMLKVGYFVGMTGTLISGRYSSAYPLIRVLDPRYYPSYNQFLAEHAVLDDYGKPIAWHSPDKLVQVLGRHSIRRSFESIYGPAAKITQVERCVMATKQREAYKQFEAMALLELEDTTLVANTGAIHALRCRQIMAHPETMGLKVGVTGKDERLDIHLADHAATGAPLVVFAPFVAEQQRLLARVRAAGLTAELLNGTVPTKRRAEIDEAFRNGRVQVLVGSPAVAGVGFNWGHCSHVIFTGLDYQDSNVVQSTWRFIRGARATPLLVTFLEYEDSIDQRIMRIVEAKSQLAATITAGKETLSLVTTN